MTAAGDQRLADLLDLWEEAVEHGEEPDLAQLCTEAPELLDEVAHQVAALKAIDARLRIALRQTLPPPTGRSKMSVPSRKRGRPTVNCSCWLKAGWESSIWRVMATCIVMWS